MTAAPTPNPASRPASTPPWGDRDWTTYYAAVAGKGPRETLLAALTQASGPPDPASPTPAIDLGAGEGRDTFELLRRGYRVLALDPHPEALRRIRAALPADAADRLTLVESGSESLDDALAVHPAFRKAAIINASFSLPFIHPDRFPRAWASIRAALADGGLFAGQFFGPEDTWATIPGRSHHTREQVQQLLAGLTILQFDESKKPGHDAEGNPKHWHAFHVVALKPLA